jgi:pimeloyl-ACP methyl ester carboxylesterase
MGFGMDMLERLNFAGAGVTLAADAAGPADGPPILFLHGSGQTRQSWGKAIVEAGKRGYRAISVEQRGHGDSGWAPDGRYDLEVFAADLTAILDQLSGAPIVVGASLGGLVGMMVAAAQPQRVRALVLVDITARIQTQGTSEVQAFMGSAPDGFASLEDAADAVAAYLPHRKRPTDTSGLARNLRERDGRYYWHWDPQMMSMGDNAKRRDPAPLEAAARSLTIPVLLVKGGRSRIVTADSAREFLEMVPHADFADIDGADHMVAGDANDAFNDAVFAFIDKLPA